MLTIITTATLLIETMDRLFTKLNEIKKAGSEAELRVMLVTADQLDQATLSKIDARLAKVPNLEGK
jgi:hypothetical protein